MSSVLIVGVAAAEVERMLASGVGPGRPQEARCPCCGGRLRGFWRGYRRAVRFGRRVGRLWIGRSVCGGCGRRHALLPSFVVPRRLDAAPVVGLALERAAGGLGHRPIAAGLGLPRETVRGWLRRARAQAAALAAGLWRLAQELGVLAPRAPPEERPLAALLRALAVAHGAAARRLGEAGLPDRFARLPRRRAPAFAHKLALGGRSAGGEDRARPVRASAEVPRWTSRASGRTGGSGRRSSATG